eukprot:TRINITY_DN5025_c1_g1_i1.p1 TRINITY_DN5025_c1_g1~~TRINITY_DN5025_c1_g1_i1.p1  ORF type:complete len:140 (+),score=57.40 TRINITY_DN5025_c1_g1_i1:170-589(+)
MGAAKLLYASLTEYVLFFGSAIGTSGHSGRYWGVIIDWPFAGEFWQWEENTIHKKVFRKGDMILHKEWAATGYRLQNGTWMLEHGSGFVPSFMPFAFADSFFSTLDFISLWRNIYAYSIQLSRAYFNSNYSNYVDCYED